MPTLSILSAGCRYHNNWIFRNVSASFAGSTSVALLGKNGSGKSTLLQAILGWVSLTEGSVSFEDEGSQERQGKLTMAAPYLDLPEELTVLELIRFQNKLRPYFGGGNESLFLETMDMPTASKMYVKVLSTGMKQRLKISLALCFASSLVLLDEPASNLDIKGRGWLTRMIERFGAGRMIVMASNDPAEYAQCTHQLQLTNYSTLNG